MNRSFITGAALSLGVIGVARADRYENSIGVQPFGGLAWIDEDGASRCARVPVAGLAIRYTHGLRDWLALEGELAAGSLASARFDDVMVSVGGGNPTPTDLARTTRFGRATINATLRLGVAWIPTISIGMGPQVGWQTAAVLVEDPSISPVGREGGLSVGLMGAARAGMDKRLTRRWVVGATVGASWGIGQPMIDNVEVAVTISHYSYSLW